MDTVEIYSFEDKYGVEMGFTTNNANEAREFGEQNELKVISNLFKYVESEIAWDFSE